MLFQDRWWEIIAAVSWAQPAVDLCRQLLACITWVDLAECLSAPTERGRFDFCRVRGFSKSTICRVHLRDIVQHWSHTNRNWAWGCQDWSVDESAGFCTCVQLENKLTLMFPYLLSAKGNIYLNDWMFAELTYSLICFLLCWYSLFRLYFRIN